MSLLGLLCICIGLSAQEKYHVKESYLIQEIVPLNELSYTYRYRCWYSLSVFPGYYVVDEKTLMTFFKNEEVEEEQMTILCDVHYGSMFVSDQYKLETRYYTSLREIIFLDNNELFKIGERLFIIRRIEYCYYDNSEKKVYVRGNKVWPKDDLQDEDKPTQNKYYEVGDVYNKDYYQCLHHITKILPNPSKIHKKKWKYAYQITEECEKETYRPLPYEYEH